MNRGRLLRHRLSFQMIAEGPESGDIALLDGTGKCKDIAGKGTWSAADAPGNPAIPRSSSRYDISCTTKEK